MPDKPKEVSRMAIERSQVGCREKPKTLFQIISIIRSQIRFRTFIAMNYHEFIEIRSDKRFGKPTIKGTRITVYDVLNWFSNGMSREDIKADFEELTDQMIDACLAYAADKERKRISAS